MAERVSRKVKALTRKLYRVMIKDREDNPNRYGGRSCQTWVRMVKDAYPDIHATDPMIRRCLHRLVEQGKIEKHGYGSQTFKAITVAEKLQAEEEDRRKARVNQIVEELKAAGFDRPHATYHAREVMISVDNARAMLELLYSHPRIHRKWFTPVSENEEA